MHIRPTLDLIIVGGGLSGSVLGLFLKSQCPNLRFKILEKGDPFSSDAPRRTWSLHDYDLKDSNWLRPYIPHSWPSYQVRFPALSRQILTSYYSLPSPHLYQAVRNTLEPEQYQTQVSIRSLNANSVETLDGQSYLARAVIDARGVESLPNGPCAYQKFLGLEVELDEPHHLDGPILMDVYEDQQKQGGYQFFYCLPWDSRRLLIEDTYYQLSPELNRKSSETNLFNYAAQKGWKIKKILDREEGALPLPLHPFQLILTENSAVPLGMRNNTFNPTTGYSFPSLLKVIQCWEPLLRSGNFDSENLWRILMTYYQAQYQKSKYYCLLNRMLFHAATPENRYLVLQRFYRLNSNLIDRFYSGTLTWSDRIRILVGKPPVPIFAALRELK